MANSLKKIIPLVLGLCLAITVHSATITWTGANSNSWSTASNWNPGSVPTASDDVIIPADLSRYPYVTSGAACHYIYVESGARIAGQENLTYTEAFVDVTLPTNRYVRIVPPTREVYSGDLFTQEQGGTWTNFTESSIADAGSGTSGNRVFPGATYISLFANNGTNYDAYMGVDYREATTSWADPFNALSHRFTEGESFDVWVDNDNESTATFHFPAGDTEYHYFRESGDIDPLTESITRTEARKSFLFDSKSISGTGYYDRTFPANGTAMFATGNPTMGLMSIKLFMEQNVANAKYVTPFIYRHNNGAENADGHGTESIIYYNAVTKKLFSVSGSATDDEVPTATDENEIDDEDSRAYINPAEGFRLMSGATKIYAIEPKLLGNFLPEAGKVSEYEYYGVSTYNGSSRVIKYGKAAGSNETGSNATYNLAITLTATDDPGVVRIGNFLQRGYVYATVDVLAQTLTISNGSQVFYGAPSAWFHGNGANIPSNRIFRISGCTDKIPNFSGEYSFKGTWNAPKVTNIGADVVFDYIVDNENGTVSISLQKPFVLYSNEFLTDDDMTYQSADEAEAYWVYKRLESTKSIDESSGGAAFILPEAVGKFSTKIESATGLGDVSTSMVNNGITITPLQGVYDYVLIDGLYPGKPNFPVIGQIYQTGTKTVTRGTSTTETTRTQDVKSNGQTKKNATVEQRTTTMITTATTYHVKILAGQLVNEINSDDLSYNYFLYKNDESINPYNRQGLDFTWICDTTEVKTETLTWTYRYGNWRSTVTSTSYNYTPAGLKWHQTGGHAQVSHLNSSVGSQGFYMSAPNTCTLTRIGDLDDGSGSGEGGGGSSETITPGSTSAPHTVTFHKDMFAANQGDFAARLAALTAAPKRRNAKAETTKASMLNIVAQTENEKRANTMLVLSEKAYDGFNRYEDAPLFDATEAAFTFATLAGEQLVGVNVSSSWTNIPLYLTSSATLTFFGIDSYDDGILYLFDAVDSVEYTLQEGAQHMLTIAEGQQVGRWFIRDASALTPASTEGITDVTDWNPIAWNPQSGTLVVRTGRNTETIATLYAMSGQCVARQRVADMAIFRGVPAGTYMLMLVSEGATKQIKTIVK